MVERGDLERLARELPTERLPDLIADLERAKAMAWARLVTPSAPAASPPASGSPPALVDAETLAEMTQLPPSWIRDRARRGKLPAVRVGRYLRFRPDDVLAALGEAPMRCRRRRKASTNKSTAQDDIS